MSYPTQGNQPDWQLRPGPPQQPPHYGQYGDGFGPNQPPPGWGWVPPPGMPPGGPPPGSGGHSKTIAVIVVVTVIVIMAAAGGAVLVFRSFHDDDSKTSTASAITPSSTPTAPANTSVSTQPSAPASSDCLPPTPGPATPAGWKTVSGQRRLSYDVPADWEVASCGTLIGWQKTCADGPFGYCPIRAMSGAAELAVPQCPETDAGMAGLPGTGRTTDINQALRSESALVRDIYTSESGHIPTVRLGPVRSLTVGGAPAVQMLATVTDIETSDCTGPTALHSMLATTVSGQPGCVLFVISLPQGGPKSADPRIIDQMVASLRPAG